LGCRRHGATKKQSGVNGFHVAPLRTSSGQGRYRHVPREALGGAASFLSSHFGLQEIRPKHDDQITEIAWKEVLDDELWQTILSLSAVM
jgi:hypothetical protein